MGGGTCAASFFFLIDSVYLSLSIPRTDNNTDEDTDKIEEKKPLPDVMPGLFFIYDITPFSLSITYANEIPLTRLIIRLCAISGGVVTISRILESAFTALVVYIAKKGVFLPS